MCEYNLDFGSEECDDCPYYRYCKSDDDYSQQEDHYRDKYYEEDI
jgi:hypothetical protein